MITYSAIQGEKMSNDLQELFKSAMAHLEKQGEGVVPVRGVDGALASLRHFVHDAPQLRDLNSILQAIAKRDDLTFCQYGFIVQLIWQWPDFVRRYEEKIEQAGHPLEEKLWPMVSESVSDIISQKGKFGASV